MHWDSAYIKICPIEAPKENRLIECQEIDANTEASPPEDREKMAQDAQINWAWLDVLILG